MLYTVAETSEMLGFSKVTIYNKINSLKVELRPYIKHKKGVLHIDDKGILILKRDLGLISAENFLKDNGLSDSDSIEKNNDFNDFKDINYLVKMIKKTVERGQENYINSLLNQIEILKSELGKKDDQLNNTLRLLENSQILIRQEKEKIFVLESQEQKENRKSIFNIFKRK